MDVGKRCSDIGASQISFKTLDLLYRLLHRLLIVEDVVGAIALEVGEFGAKANDSEEAALGQTPQEELQSFYCLQYAAA